MPTPVSPLSRDPTTGALGYGFPGTIKPPINVLGRTPSGNLGFGGGDAMPGGFGAGGPIMEPNGTPREFNPLFAPPVTSPSAPLGTISAASPPTAPLGTISAAGPAAPVAPLGTISAANPLAPQRPTAPLGTISAASPPAPAAIPLAKPVMASAPTAVAKSASASSLIPRYVLPSGWSIDGLSQGQVDMGTAIDPSGKVSFIPGQLQHLPTFNSTSPGTGAPATNPLAAPPAGPGASTPPGTNPIARPPGTPAMPGQPPVGAPGAPGTTPPNPGGTTLPYGGASPGQPQTWQDVLSQFFSGDPSSGESRGFSATGIDPRMDALYQFALGQALSRYGDPNGQTFYSGQTVADLTPDELQAQGMLRGLAGSMGGTAGNGLDYINTLLDRAKNPQNDPTLQAAISSTLGKMDQDATDPGGVFSNIRGGALADGSFGGTRQGVLEAIANSRLQQNKADTAAQMALAGRSENLTAAQNGLSSLPTAISAAEAPAGMLSAVGQQNRDQSQAQMTDALQRWAYNTFAPDQRLQNLFSLLGASPTGGFSVGSSAMSPAQLAAVQASATSGPSTAQNILGGAAGVAGIWSILHDAGII